MAFFAPHEHPAMTPPLVTLSIVSHGQGAIVRHLLADLRTVRDVSFEVLLTVNTPEDLGYVAEAGDLPLRVLHNEVRKGFGANHNAAFRTATGRYFAVVNPDIRVPAPVLRLLIDALESLNAGACAPEVRSSTGNREDSARRFPTPARLFSRVVLRRRQPDYFWAGEPVVVDWVAGMFIVFRADRFRQVGGFDERYFMYMEDVDICRRLRRLGLPSVVQPAVSVVHDAQRASRRSFRHLSWHLSSALRYFTGP
jgi:N-acetylglucosaminyl-diphospho-decaprenol L-rhamnosyltransferase